MYKMVLLDDDDDDDDDDALLLVALFVMPWLVMSRGTEL